MNIIQLVVTSVIPIKVAHGTTPVSQTVMKLTGDFRRSLYRCTLMACLPRKSRIPLLVNFILLILYIIIILTQSYVDTLEYHPSGWRPVPTHEHTGLPIANHHGGSHAKRLC